MVIVVEPFEVGLEPCVPELTGGGDSEPQPDVGNLQDESATQGADQCLRLEAHQLVGRGGLVNREGQRSAQGEDRFGPKAIDSIDCSFGLPTTGSAADAAPASNKHAHPASVA